MLLKLLYLGFINMTVKKIVKLFCCNILFLTMIGCGESFSVGVSLDGTNGNSGTNDSISMVADRAAAPMRMGDPSTMPTTTPAQSTGGSTVVTSGQELPERQRALEEAANRAAASDKARTAEVREKQAISEASINYMERQLTTQEQMRDLLRVIAEKVGHPTVVPQSAAPVPSAQANDMGSTHPQRVERSAGSAPAAVTFKR